MSSTVTDRTVELERKIDELSAQVSFLADEAMAARLRRERWNELSHDAMPIARSAMDRAAAEFADVDVDPDQLVRLLKRLAANVDTFERLVVALEAGVSLVDDVSALGTDAMMSAVHRLDELEKRGYFRFAGAAVGVADKVVTNFTEDDVEQLGENIVLILNVVKELTQPEIMAIVYRMIAAVERQREVMEQEPEKPPSLFAIARKANAPEVRRGLSRALDTLSAVSEVDAALPGGPNRFENTNE